MDDEPIKSKPTFGRGERAAARLRASLVILGVIILTVLVLKSFGLF